MTKLFIRNEYIPNGETLEFTTSQDQQTAVSINVYKCETSVADDCRLIGTYVVSGIPPAPRGTSKVEVKFRMDANGILHAMASGKSEITITKKGRSSQEEIERMVWKAEEFAEEEKKVKEKIDACNALETYLYNRKSQISDGDKIGGKLESSEKEKMETAIKEALEWLDDNQSADKENFDQKLNEVEAVFSSLASYHKKKPGDGLDKQDVSNENNTDFCKGCAPRNAHYFSIPITIGLTISLAFSLLLAGFLVTLLTPVLDAYLDQYLD